VWLGNTGRSIASHRVRRAQRRASFPKIQARDRPLSASRKGTWIDVTLAACAFRWAIPGKWFVLRSETMTVSSSTGALLDSGFDVMWSSRPKYAVVMSHRFALDWEFRDLSPGAFIP
jgi:hypothetical protein